MKEKGESKKKGRKGGIKGEKEEKRTEVPKIEVWCAKKVKWKAKKMINRYDFGKLFKWGIRRLSKSNIIHPCKIIQKKS